MCYSKVIVHKIHTLKDYNLVRLSSEDNKLEHYLFLSQIIKQFMPKLPKAYALNVQHAILLLYRLNKSFYAISQLNNTNKKEYSI